MAEWIGRFRTESHRNREEWFRVHGPLSQEVLFTARESKVGDGKQTV